MNSYLVIPTAQMVARLRQHLGKDAFPRSQNSRQFID